jgi:hypothetical protein
MLLEQPGVIDNFQHSAPIDRTGRSCGVAYCDSTGSLFFKLARHRSRGKLAVGPATGGPGEQSYTYNSNTLKTVFETASGKFQFLDFAPRSGQYGRVFRPTQFYRIVEPLEGPDSRGVRVATRVVSTGTGSRERLESRSVWEF